MQNLYPLAWTAFVVCLFLMWFFTHRANHKERLLMIEKGIDPETTQKKKEASNAPWIKLAAIIIGLGAGLLIIAVLVATRLLDNGGNALPLGILGVCGGAGMLAGNYLKNGKSKS